MNADQAERIKVRASAQFMVDLKHDLATDLYSLAPVELFRGKGKKQAVFFAISEPSGFAAINYTGAAVQRANLQAEFDRFIRSADLVVIRDVEPEVANVIVTAIDGTRARFNGTFWAALDAAADCAMLPRWSVKPNVPAVFFKDGDPFALLMPLWTEREWRKGQE